MKNINLIFVEKIVMTIILCLFILVAGESLLEAALPESGVVDNLYGVKWENPHFKKSKIYITLKNETSVFQALSLTALFVDSDGEVMADAWFEVGLAPGKSVRTFSKLENNKGDLGKSVKIIWRSK